MVPIKNTFAIFVGVAITLIAAQPSPGQLRGSSSQQLAEEVSSEYLMKEEVNSKEVVEVTTDEMTAPNKEKMPVPITDSNLPAIDSDFPDDPNFPSHPDFPFDPNVPSHPDSPDDPNVPSHPDFPFDPNVPSHPDSPDDPNVPSHGGGGSNVPSHGGGGLVVASFIQLVPVGLEIIVFCAFAVLYKQKVVDRITRLQPVPPGTTALAPDFKYGMFSCFDDTSICMHAWCCFACRVAHNTQVTGVMDYWMAVVAMILSGFGATCCVPQCLQTYFRMETKKKLGVNPEPLMDCICSACCGCCAVAQAAREIDEKGGVKVACCCQLQQGTPPVVQAVMVSATTELSSNRVA